MGGCLSGWEFSWKLLEVTAGLEQSEKAPTVPTFWQEKCANKKSKETCSDQQVDLTDFWIFLTKR